VVAGHYLTAVFGPTLNRSFRGSMAAEDLASAIAIVVVGVLWARARVGAGIRGHRLAIGVGIGASVLLFLAVRGLFALPRVGWPASQVATFVAEPQTRWPLVGLVLAALFGFQVAMPIVGGGDAFARAAQQSAPPRLRALRRITFTVLACGFLTAVVGTFLYTHLVPTDQQLTFMSVPWLALADHALVRPWFQGIVRYVAAFAIVLAVIPAIHAAVGDMHATLQRLAQEGRLPAAFGALHPRFGTPFRVIDGVALSAVAITLASGGRLPWLSRAYGMAIGLALLLKVATLLRLRRTYPAGAYRAPLNLRLRTREVPCGLLVTGAAAALAAISAIMLGDIPSIVACASIALAAGLFEIAGRGTAVRQSEDASDAFDVLAGAELDLDPLQARPGNILVPVRNPGALDQVAVAIRDAGDRDVVVMSVRLSPDGDDHGGAARRPTPHERELFTAVTRVAERLNYPTRLLIVPARDLADAIVTTAVRLRSSEVYAGESSTLAAVDQARLLGEAWERADKPEPLNIRLVIVRPSGRADTYHLGAHPPSLSPGDLDLIHRIWLDATKAIGPHVHHHDVVRAALTQMEEQLTGPTRDQTIAAIRDTARPTEELAAVVRARDYARLRDMLRNRHGGDVAELLTTMGLEDQVLVFRVLPRRDAAAVFEYLSHDAKEALLKAMAQEDIAALLNNMAPDDRTMFLEELPAAATRQLLELLSPNERAVARTLLGYPEESVGRLMTPHYVSVQEDWTVQQVLDYVRDHGQDSETLNVIYVIDEQGLLIDDIRIRELLLAPLQKRVSDLMDRRFVALKATDDQHAAVAIFRQYDRSALPVTDTAGMLIGIVTIDDVLDVAEAAATREIQLIGGSEALDEPYMHIAFSTMVRKRAGWLTALFIGEMLTATAMGAFQNEISKAVVLALFVPLIISSGGNSGSQASTLVIRALALGEVGLIDWWRVVRREFAAGLALGAILGSIGFLRISLWSAFSDIYGPHWLLVAITVSISLIGVVLWGTLSGSVLPFVLRRLGFDPAASSAPFVATLVDVTGLVIYFSVALLVMRGTLL
jgi:magnesium transporter